MILLQMRTTHVPSQNIEITSSDLQKLKTKCVKSVNTYLQYNVKITKTVTQ